MSKLIKYIVSAAAALALSACSDEMPRGTEVNEEGFHVYKLDMDIAFDGEEGSRAAHQWTSSDYVYVDFETGDTPVWGYAYYNTYSEEWLLYMVSSLPESVRSGQCTCWYFSDNYQHSLSTSTEEINLNYSQTPYQAQTTFSFVNDKVSVSAKLNPVMGRVKLRSANAQSYIWILGPSVPKYLDLKTGQAILDNMDRYVSLSNYDSESGLYTSEYINAYYFADDTERVFKIKDGTPQPDVIYMRDFASNKNVLAAGTSGYIDVPTAESHDGWIMDEWRTYSGSYEYYGNVNDLSPEENTYYFHTVNIMPSLIGIKVTVSHDAYSIYSGSEPTKKSAALYVEVFDGVPGEDSEPIGYWNITLYKPDGSFTTDTYNTERIFMLPSTEKVNDMPYYRVSVITDGVQMRLTQTEITNWF